MIRVNLLPHREEFRQQQILEYIIVYGAAVLFVLFVVVSLNISATSDLTSLQEETAALQVQNAVLSKKIGELRNLDALRKDVEGKLQIVDELQAGRFRSLETLNAIAEAIPENIWLVSYEDGKGQIKLKAFGESSQAIANFMRKLEKTDVFTGVQLTVDQLAEEDGAKVRRFGLVFRRLSLAEQEALEKNKKDEVKK